MATSTQPILFNDFAAEWSLIRKDMAAALERVGQSGQWILGKEVARFETSLASYWGVSHAIGCASGLDALEIALRALKIGKGDFVLTTPLSAFATTLAIMHVGATPVFVDVERTGLMNLDLCEKAFKENASLKTWIPVHLYGHAMNLERIASLKNKYGLTIIEDCAQAIGARSKGKAVGSVGQMSATSFYPTKNLGAVGDGGGVLTQETLLAQKSKEIRDYGQSAKYQHTTFGLNSRLDELQAAFLDSALLPRLPEWISRRRQIASRYATEINHSALKALPAPPDSESVWALYPLQVKGNRDSFQKYLESNAIHTSIHYPHIIPDQDALKTYGSYEVAGEVEIARELSRSLLSIPIHPFLSDEDVSSVVTACNQWS